MKKYLLVSAMPTPNGGLHLGHLAAQFLPQDVFKRYQQQRGHRVTFYGGFDVYDNAICVAAENHGLSPYEMAVHFQNVISDELHYFGIGTDALFNYLDPDMVERSQQAISKARRKLSPFISPRVITYPYSRRGKPVTGNWLSGRCKRCHTSTNGYSCDACGISITPDDIYDLRFRNATLAGEITWQDKTVDFVRVPTVDLYDYINQQDISKDLKNFSLALNHNGTQTYQWTAFDEWGLSLASDQADHVFFNRNFTLIEQLIVSQLYSERYAEEPFSPGSDVCTVLAYGKDNIGLLLVDLPHLARGTGLVTPYRHHWVSHFYCLNGSKMSTSKNLALWLSRLISEGISADAVRAYICSKYAHDKDTDLNLDGLKEEEIFCLDLKKAISELSRLTSRGSGQAMLSKAMYDIGELTEQHFSHSRPDLVRYYELFHEFCSLIYYINSEEMAGLWRILFTKHFSALVPDMAALVSDSAGEL